MCAGLNPPHWALLQVTVQLTPALLESLVTVAPMVAAPEMSIELGGVEPDVKAIVIAVAVMVMVA